MKKFIVVIICLLVLCGCGKETDNPKKITCAEKDRIINDASSSSGKEAMFIDVRTKEEYDEGHLKGAINIPYDEVTEIISTYGTVEYDTPIIVYCKSGNRSNTAAQALIKSGYKKVYDLGAMSNCIK